MSFDPRDKIWEVCFDTYYECYFEEMVADHLLYRWCIVDDINKWLIAITTSGSAVSGWALWSDPDYKLVWIGLASLSALLAITHTSLGVQQRIKNWESSKKSFTDLRIELSWLRQDMSINPDFDANETQNRMKLLRKQYRDNMSRLSPDTLRNRRLERKVQNKLNETISDQIEG